MQGLRAGIQRVDEKVDSLRTEMGYMKGELVAEIASKTTLK